MHAEQIKNNASLRNKSSDMHGESRFYADRNSDLLSGESIEKYDSTPSHALPPAHQGQLVMQCKGLSDNPKPTKVSGHLIQRKVKSAGLPDSLKTGIEKLSGICMDDVSVHYNSHKPAQQQALAYTQGAAIHVAPRQEQHLPHEAWHVVQQKQGRVKPTLQKNEKGMINDDAGLEREADMMGAEALNIASTPGYRMVADYGTPQPLRHSATSTQRTIQKKSEKKTKRSNPNHVVRFAGTDEQPIDERFTVKKYKFTSMVDGKMGSVYFEGNIRIRLTHAGGPVISDTNHYEVEQYHVSKDAHDKLLNKPLRNAEEYGWIKRKAKKIPRSKGKKRTIVPFTGAARNRKKYRLVEVMKAKKEFERGGHTYKEGEVAHVHPSRGVAVRQTFTQKDINAIVRATNAVKDSFAAVIENNDHERPWHQNELHETEEEKERKKLYGEQKDLVLSAVLEDQIFQSRKNSVFYNALAKSKAGKNIINKVRKPEDVTPEIDDTKNFIEKINGWIKELDDVFEEFDLINLVQDTYLLRDKTSSVNVRLAQQAGFFRGYYVQAKTAYEKAESAYENGKHAIAYQMSAPAYFILILLMLALENFLSYIKKEEANSQSEEAKASLKRSEIRFQASMDYLDKASDALKELGIPRIFFRR